AGVGATAVEAIPQAHRLRGRRHQERRQALRGRHHGGVVPRGVRGRHAVGAPRYRGAGVCREGRRLLAQGRHGRSRPNARALRALPGATAASPNVVTADRTGPVLAVFAHPDDAEISCGATLSTWSSLGREVHLLVLTNGDRGSADPAMDRAELARTRRRETEEAAAVLGLASVRILGVHDGELENTAEVRGQVVRAIRELRPQTVLSCDPTAWFFENRYYNHSDHRTAGVIALDSVFPGAGNPHFFAEHLHEG